MQRMIWMGLGAAICGCAPSEPSDPGGEDVEVLATRVIEVADDGTQTEARRQLTRASLAGFYIDHFGYGLTLRADGSFECSMWCCLGPRGKAAGTWEVGADGITLTYTRTDGVLATHPPEPLTVAALGPHHLLVEERWLDMFRRRGPCPFGYNLRASEAELAVQNAFRRMIDGQVKAAEPVGPPDRGGGE